MTEHELVTVTLWLTIVAIFLGMGLVWGVHVDGWWDRDRIPVWP